LATAGGGNNGKTFLKQSLRQWFMPVSELTLTDACDENFKYLVEEKHDDGPMSVFHAGLTLSGKRDLYCFVPGYGRILVENQPGTFYFGNLSGPEHQAFHQPCDERDLLFVPGLGWKSVTIMMRTGLHPHERSRFNTSPTSSPKFRKLLERIFIQGMQDDSLRLPTFEEVLRAHDKRVGGTLSAGLVAAGDGSSKVVQPPPTSVTAADGSSQVVQPQPTSDGKRRRLMEKSSPGALTRRAVPLQ
jgi:hypothetical protein